MPQPALRAEIAAAVEGTVMATEACAVVCDTLSVPQLRKLCALLARVRSTPCEDIELCVARPSGGLLLRWTAAGSSVQDAVTSAQYVASEAATAQMDDVRAESRARASVVVSGLLAAARTVLSPQVVPRHRHMRTAHVDRVEFALPSETVMSVNVLGRVLVRAQDTGVLCAAELSVDLSTPNGLHVALQLPAPTLRAPGE